MGSSEIEGRDEGWAHRVDHRDILRRERGEERADPRVAGLENLAECALAVHRQPAERDISVGAEVRRLERIPVVGERQIRVAVWLGLLLVDLTIVVATIGTERREPREVEFVVTVFVQLVARCVVEPLKWLNLR